MGRRLLARFEQENVDIRETTSHNQIRDLPGETTTGKYREAKRTMVVGVRKSAEFQTSKPSAEYALPLVTGCPGHCHYCYLQTSLGDKPYVRVYVNHDHIFERARRYIEARKPEITRFEGSCVSDPVPVEPYTGSLAAAITFFADESLGRFRFVTKYDQIDSLLDLDHRDHTEIRFSINTPHVVKTFEPGTSPLDGRIAAAGKVAAAGYPLGFLIAPIIIYQGWREDYARSVENLRSAIPGDVHPSFELITHRFTNTARRLIQQRYPESSLEMDEEDRQWKWGQFGYGKYVYRAEDMREIDRILKTAIARHFPNSEVKYLV